MAEFFRNLFKDRSGAKSRYKESERIEAKLMVADELAVIHAQDIQKDMHSGNSKFYHDIDFVDAIGAISRDVYSLSNFFGYEYHNLLSARQFSAEHCPSLHAVLDHLLRERRKILLKIYNSYSLHPDGSPERRALSAVFDHVKSQIDRLDEQIRKLQDLRGQLHDRFLQVQIMGIVGRVDDTTNNQLMQMVEEEVGRSQAVLDEILGDKIG